MTEKFVLVKKKILTSMHRKGLQKVCGKYILQKTPHGFPFFGTKINTLLIPLFMNFIMGTEVTECGIYRIGS